MSINFPTALDDFSDPVGSASMEDSHPELHKNVNDAIEALEAKVGVTDSADTNSLDYKIAHASAATDHSTLSNLDYASTGHTGFEPAKGDEDNYVTDAEKIVIGNTSGTNSGDNAANSLYSGLATSKQNVIVTATTATAGATAAKTATIEGYTLTTGDVIALTLTSGNTAASMTLNINGGGAVAIHVGGLAPTALTGTVTAGGTIFLYYDGTNFDMTGATRNTDTNTTYQEILESEIATGTASTARAISGRRAAYLLGLAVPEGTAVKSTGEAGGTKFLREDGDGTCSWQTPGGGDMLLGTEQSVTGLKIFDKDKISMKGTSTGTTVVSTANTSATSYTQTLPARNGTVANLDNTFYIGTTSCALNRSSAAMTIAGLTLTTPNIGTPSAGTLTNCTGYPAASTTAAGISELAIASEVNTGTSATLAVTPDALAGSVMGTKGFCVIAVAPTTDVSVADGKAYIMIPECMNGMNLVRANASVVTAGTTNATTIDIYNVTDSHDMLSTAISIASAGTVGTAGTVNASYDDVATNDILRIDVTSASTTNAKGLQVILEFRLP